MILAALTLAAAASTASPVATAHHAVSTTSPAAQQLFDRGLTDIYGYDGDDATAEFSKAALADPHLAMAFWGLALADGSDLNTPLTSDAFDRAKVAIARAQPLLGYANDEERALIAAVTLRYSGSFADTQRDEQNYRDAMERVVAQYPNDDDAAMLLVEALMEHSGMHWTKNGTPLGDSSVRIIGLIQTVLTRNPTNIMANHLCIHAYDSAHDRTPAVACAQALDAMKFDPNDEHLTHMPAHLWIEIGKWRNALASSERAWALIEAWAHENQRDVSAAKYGVHDATLALSAAMMGGDRSSAETWGGRLTQLNGNDYRPLIAARFGDWTAVPKTDPTSAPGEKFARGLAAVAQDQPATAQALLKQLQQANIVPDSDLLAASVDESHGNVDGALAALRRADAWQQANQPAEYVPFFPADERIGALLYRAGRYADALTAFTEVVNRRPFAPRPLFGLWQTLLRLGATDQAAAAETRFQGTWGGPTPLTMNDF